MVDDLYFPGHAEEVLRGLRILSRSFKYPQRYIRYFGLFLG
jgi:hypothetical protein